MTKNSLTVTILATVISVSFVVQLACGGPALNNNDQAQVASARNASAASSNSNVATAGGLPLGTPPPVTSSANTAAAIRRPVRADIERDPERFRRIAEAQGGHLGNGPDDVWLWVNANFELARSSELRPLKIQIDVNDGVVTLRGTVTSRQQSETATRIVRDIEGVKDVINSLTVSSRE